MLPYVDEHRIVVHAPRDVVWPALLRYVHSSIGVGEGSAFGRLLGVQPPSGFAVSEEIPDEAVHLTGRHRFSTYMLVFSLADAADGTTVKARTYAEFPGLMGRAYRTLVIDSRIHVLAVRRMLRAIRWLCRPQTGNRATR